MDDFETLFLHVLVQLAVILVAAQLGGWLMKQVGQPQVVGEITAGLILGPSLLGRFAPGITAFVFPESTIGVFRILSELGLVLLMFLIGLEFDFSHLRHVGRTSVAVAIAGIVCPFMMGIGLALWMYAQLALEVNKAGFVLIVGVALSITGIPILGRIMMEFGIHRTAVATLTITAAAVDDAVGWILLAAIGAVIHGDFQTATVLWMLSTTAVFVALCRFPVRWMFEKLEWLLFREPPQDNHRVKLSHAGLAFILIVVVLAAVATNLIGIFSIFGPFVLGACLSDHHRLRDAVTERLSDFVHVFFLPIFFTASGLRTNVGLLESWWLWLMCLLCFATATVGKLGGCALAARACGCSWRDSGCVAVMMNTRALMGLIAINVGREMGVIPNTVFCMLVIMALATTFMTSPLLRRLLPDQPLPTAQMAPLE